LFIINELLETSNSDRNRKYVYVIKEERLKDKNYVDIVNEYSDKEVYNYIW